MWQIVTADDAVELYDANGLPLSITARGGRGVRMAYSVDALQSVTDDFGRSLSFAYDQDGRLAQVSAPGGETMRYSYGGNGHLAAVTYADDTTRQYLYENAAFPYALTDWLIRTASATRAGVTTAWAAPSAASTPAVSSAIRWLLIPAA